MAHKEQEAFVARIKQEFPAFFEGGRVLEIGSLDINGTVRKQFRNSDYVGIDVGEGPGVDVVCQGQDYAAPDGSFDVTISCEVMEHNPFWVETFLNMARLCRPGGLVLMTCASHGRPEHGTRRTTPQYAPLIEWDYYKNLGSHDFVQRIRMMDWFECSVFCSDHAHHDLYFVGFRKGGPVPDRAAQKLLLIKLHYHRKNFSDYQTLKRTALIKLVGEEAYRAGPVTLTTILNRGR